MNLIFICVFHQHSYIDLLKLLITSISVKGNIDVDSTDILIMTSSSFLPLIQKELDGISLPIKYYILELHSLFEAGCARLNIFNYDNIQNYTNILYLDTDILINSDINTIFNLELSSEKIYALEEGCINHEYWGGQFFDFTKINSTTQAFSSGILLFKNSSSIKLLFENIQKHIQNDIYIKKNAIPICLDQPFIVYNAISQNKYDNQLLKQYVINNPNDDNLDKIIYHFPGQPGHYSSKISKMTHFWNKIIEQSNNINLTMINTIINNRLTLVSKERLINLMNHCNTFKKTKYSFVECGVAKGGCLALMKYLSGNYNKVFGFDSFEGMPNITNEDIDNYNKSCPLKDFGKVGDNLSGGIENVLHTFKSLNINMDNVNLVKGFFQDTLNIKENIDKIGDIAILRLDGDWYESTKVCLEKLYDKVIIGGIIIIHDYGHYIGAKRAVDEFRNKNHIISPLIQTDYTEYWWIKSKIDTINTINIHEDIWTCSDEMRRDIADFFKNKTQFKIVEIGSHKGYTTKVLSYMFSKVYCVDNNIEWTSFNKNYNIDRENIEYVMLDIYNDNWNILPNDMDVAFIDAGHSYEACKSDILNSINRFNNLQYIIFDDYGVWSGVKQVVDEMMNKNILIFEKFIGLTDVPGPSGIVRNTYEGIICRVNNFKVKHVLDNKKYSWQNGFITFLENGLMDAFGKGIYKELNKYTVQADFGGRNHTLIFNNDYTEFTSTRHGDNEIVKGQIIL
jgi:O-methyltransferase